MKKVKGCKGESEETPVHIQGLGDGCEQIGQAKSRLPRLHRTRLICDRTVSSRRNLSPPHSKSDLAHNASSVLTFQCAFSHGRRIQGHQRWRQGNHLAAAAARQHVWRLHHKERGRCLPDRIRLEITDLFHPWYGLLASTCLPIYSHLFFQAGCTSRKSCPNRVSRVTYI